MNRSIISPIITLFAVITAGMLLLFVTKGSADLAFSRGEMPNDKSTHDVLVGYMAQMKKESSQLADASDAASDTAMENDPASSNAGGGNGPTVVLWMSIRGFRGDYIGDNTETPFFDRMIQEGATTDKLRPNFPCLEFPGHVSLATGTLVEKHGIPLDRFRTESGEVVDRPLDQSLMKAEPIWTTATRQGIRTLVHDWPMSQKQPAENAAAISLPSYDPALTDQQRLDALYAAWSGDKDPNKLRLLMVSLNGILDGGMKAGPRKPEAYKSVEEMDKLLGEFFKKVEENWSTLAPAGAKLAVIISTDHGLVDLDKNINLVQLLGEELNKNVEVVAHDGVAHLFFKDMPANEGEKKIIVDKLDGELKKRIYFRTIPREELKPEWAYTAADRIGDRVLVLKAGYAFTDATSAEPVFDPGEGPGKFGGFGYPVEDSIRMSGQSIIWGIPSSPATGDLGEINYQKFHATACKLLGIKPADGAVTETLPVN